MYFDRQADKTSRQGLCSRQGDPEPGRWLEFDIDKRDTVGVRIDRKRRQAVTVLLKAIGWTNERIRERFGWSESTRATLEKDDIAGEDEALLDIYRKLRPGEPPTRETTRDPAGQPVLQPQAVRRGQGRRCKVSKKPVAVQPIRHGTPPRHDIVATMEYLAQPHAGEVETAGE